jgi:hypothetical protein
LLYGRKPKISNFRTFGCPTYFKRYEPSLDKKKITNKQQIQRASRGIFVGFPENSSGWLVYSASMRRRLEITRDAHFDENFRSTLTFDSKPFEGAVPIRSQMSPTALAPAYSNPDEPPKHQIGSVADLGIPSSSYSDEIEERSNTEYIDNFDHLVSSKPDSNDKNQPPESLIYTRRSYAYPGSKAL